MIQDSLTFYVCVRNLITNGVLRDDGLLELGKDEFKFLKSGVLDGIGFEDLVLAILQKSIQEYGPQKRSKEYHYETDDASEIVEDLWENFPEWTLQLPFHYERADNTQEGRDEGYGKNYDLLVDQEVKAYTEDSDSPKIQNYQHVWINWFIKSFSFEVKHGYTGACKQAEYLKINQI